MGYRSDVAYAVRFKDKEHLQGFLAAIRMTELDDEDAKRAFDDLVHYTEEHRTPDHWLTFEIEGVKWYETYRYVKAHERFLERSEDFGASWELVRIGENEDDIERQSGGDDVPLVLGVSRSIVWDI